MTDLLKNLREKKSLGKRIKGRMYSIKKSFSDNKNSEFDFSVAVHRITPKKIGSDLLCNENANDEIRLALGNQKKIPKNLIISICGTDPFLNLEIYLDELAKLGITGVQNYPTIGLFDGYFRKNLESTGLSYSSEKDVISKSNEMGLVSIAVVFNENNFDEMINAGAQIIIIHPGLDFGESTESKENYMYLEQACQKYQLQYPELIILKMIFQNNEVVDGSIGNNLDGAVYLTSS